ncbi:MAG: YegS/Rv2252/BmrU family lipid kinase [Oscillospiraceae bacterium]
MRKKLLLVVNPISGKKLAAGYMLHFVDRFDKAGYSVIACCTQKDKSACEIVINRGADMDLIVCCGGDGTLKETICGVMALGKDISIGYIPMGTTNDFARAFGIPIDINKALEAVLEGVPRPVDIGTFGDEYFNYVAAFGNFTDISYTTSQRAKNLLGRGAYFLHSADPFFKMKSYSARVEADGEVFKGKYFYGSVTNSECMGGLPVLKNLGVEFDDGLLELVLVEMVRNPADILSIANSLAKKNIGDNKRIIVRHCKEVRFIFDKPTDFSLDGECAEKITDVIIKDIKCPVKIIAKSKELITQEDLVAEVMEDLI